MNKYFLSLMSILILFQSFKVADEIFNHKKDQKKGYIILEQDDEEEAEPTKKRVQINAPQQDVDEHSGSKVARKGSGFVLLGICCHNT